MLAYDVFRDDSFSALEVTEVAGSIVFIPQMLNDMGIFEVEPISTTDVGIYKDDETLALVPITERGAPETLPERDTSKLVKLPTAALRQRDRINSSEVQNLFTMGMPFETGLERAWNEVDKRQRKLIRKLELTREYHRLAALQGKLLDSDGSVYLDYFDRFDFIQAAAISFNFATLVDGNLREKVSTQVIEPMMRALRDRKGPGTYVGALCGSTFFHALQKNKEYRETFLNIPAASGLLQDTTWKYIDAFGVRWMHFMGTDDLSTLAIPTNECKFFPIGAQDVFKEYRAPGEDWDQVNQADGREFYSIVSPDYRPNMMEWVDIYVRAYPLFACIAPNVLARGVLA